MIGKYSPTVNFSYGEDQDWHQKHCLPTAEDPNPIYDRDGYDSYGYDANDRDRAGNREEDYYGDEGEELYVRVERDWWKMISMKIA